MLHLLEEQNMSTCLEHTEAQKFNLLTSNVFEQNFYFSFLKFVPPEIYMFIFQHFTQPIMLYHIHNCNGQKLKMKIKGKEPKVA